MTKERLPATGRRQDFGRFIILGYADYDLRYNIGVLQNIARRIEAVTFGVEREFAIQDVAFNFRSGGSMTVAADAVTLKPFAYSSQLILAPMLEGYRRRIMLTTARAVEEKWQGEEVELETLRFSFNMHSPDFVGGIMGWAPPVITYYKSGVVAELEWYDRVTAEAKLQPTGNDELDAVKKMMATVKLYPFFRLFTESPIMAGALEYTLLRTRYRDRIYKPESYKPESGLMKQLWDKDSIMLYRAEKASRRTEIISEILKKDYNCDPTTGDALVVMGPKKGWRPFTD